jgi:hypothetical protein
MAKLQHLVAGAGVFTAAMSTGWYYAKSQQELPKKIAAAAAAGEASTADGHCSGCAFDRLAGVYDDVVGREESTMGMGLLRWWLLREAQVCRLGLGSGDWWQSQACRCSRRSTAAQTTCMHCCSPSQSHAAPGAP